MAFVHELPGWPYLRWDDQALSLALAEVRHIQGRLLGTMAALGFDARTQANLNALTAEVTQSSAIEGETFNPEEVRSSIARRLGLDTAGLRRLGRDVEAVVEMMLDATGRYLEPLSKQRLCAWHAALFPTGRSGMTPIAVGEWRPEEAGEMQVVSGPLGRERVHFRAPDAARLEPEMARFLEWFNAPPTTDPVLRAGVAHLWFVTIHPFEDGNGRIARAIAELSLARADGSKERFYSMSTQIAVERQAYYRELESAQRGDLDITPWLAWFLDCLKRALENSERSTAAVLYKASLWQRINVRPVNQRQQLVVNRMLNDFSGFLTNSKYARLAKCSADTALRDIRDLLARGILVRNAGGGRSTSYRLGEPDAITP